MTRHVPTAPARFGGAAAARALRLQLLVAAMAVVAGCAHAQPLVAPDSGPWASGKGFQFDSREKKTRQSVSGMACNLDANQQPVCLVAFDEGVEARFASLGKEALTVQAERVVLRAESGELDAEGVATDGRYFYVTGSHSAKRSDCKSNPASRHVLRFRVDPASGRALRLPAGDPKGALVGYQDSGRLWGILQALPELQPFVGERMCLGSDPPSAAPGLSGRQGLNIEGLALRGGRLTFGLRGPVHRGVARVVSVDAEALFHPGDDAKPVVTQLALGERRGIRDMVAVKDGFLLLAGPDDSRSSSDVPWTLHFWNGLGVAGVTQLPVLATLDIRGVKLRSCDSETKPEAITVLAESATAYRVLVLSDGMCDGGPLAFTIRR